MRETTKTQQTTMMRFFQFSCFALYSDAIQHDTNTIGIITINVALYPPHGTI